MTEPSNEVYNLFSMNQFMENEQMFLVWAVIIGTLSLALLALSIIWKFTPTTVTQKIRWAYDWAMRHKTSLIILILFIIGMKFFVEYQEQVRMLKGTIVAPAAPILSFPGNVSVLTLTGQVLIKDIKVGDAVVSFDLERNESTTSIVKEVFSRTDREFVTINKQLRVTRLHPFAVRESSGAILWKEAGDIVSGDCLFSTLGRCLEVENAFIAVGDPEHVYNIHVTGPENYFVLMNTTPVLVHNKTVPSARL